MQFEIAKLGEASNACFRGCVQWQKLNWTSIVLLFSLKLEYYCLLDPMLSLAHKTNWSVLPSIWTYNLLKYPILISSPMFSFTITEGTL